MARLRGGERSGHVSLGTLNLALLRSNLAPTYFYHLLPGYSKLIHTQAFVEMVSDEVQATPEIKIVKKAIFASCSARATQAYCATEDDQLTVPAGAQLQLLGEDCDGWTLALYDGDQGLLPSTFFEKLATSWD